MSAHQSNTENHSYTNTYTADFWGGLFVALGLAGVVATSVLYGMSPPEAALPGMMTDPATAQAAALRGADILRAAGWIGIVSSGIYMPAAILISRGLWRMHPAAAIGWAVLAVCGVIFIFVDGLIVFAFVDANAAQSEFATAKYLFDRFFLIATLISGIGAFLVYGTLAARRTPVVPRWIGWLGVPVALITVTAGAAGLTGHPLAQLAGPSVMVGSAIGVMLGAFIAVNGWRRDALGHRR